MKKQNLFLRIFAIIIVFCLVFCGCKDRANTSSQSSQITSKNTATDTQIASVSQTDVETDIITSDPQPIVKGNQSGAFVNAAELESKEGKANGIDVSKWQGKIDWKKVKASGIDFAIIRIGYRAENGKIYKDECADYNIQQADKNGILVGVYFFSTAISPDEAVTEAEWVAKAIKSYPISYPVVWDCEGYSDPESRMYNLTTEQRTTNALSFLNKIKLFGYDGMFYCSVAELKNSSVWDTKKLEDFKIWVAYYPEITYPKISNPDYSGNYDMWQYTNKGKVSGVNGDTDMIVSYFRSKKAEPKSKEKAPTASAPEVKDNIYTSVSEKVTPKDTVNLRDTASTSGKIIATVKNGDVLNRVAIGTNGWSKISYNGKTVFAVSSYLTADLSYKTPQKEPDDGFSPVNEKVTAKDKTNLRSVPSSTDSSTIVYTLKNGEIALRIGISSSGWSKLSYNGKTLYAVSSYLTTNLSYKPPVESSNADSSGLKTQFTSVNEQVTAKSETNLRSLPSVSDSEIIYTLKNGEYVTRTGVSSNGWSRLEYNGKTVYAVSSYLQK